MAEWWNAMGIFEQILAGLGVVSVLMLIIQAVMALLGAVGGGADIDADISDLSGDVGGDIGDLSADAAHGTDLANAQAAGGLAIFTIQGVVTFFAIFSWSGLLFIKSGVNIAVGLIIAAIMGYLAMMGMAWLMRAMVKLQYDGTTDIRNAIGSVCSVYLTIPPRRAHTGKVSILIQGRLSEMDAVTDEEESIPTGAQVQVTGVSGKTTLLVKRK